MPEELATVEAWVSVSAALGVLLMLARCWWGSLREGRSRCGRAVIKSRWGWGRMRCMNEWIDGSSKSIREYWVLVGNLSAVVAVSQKLGCTVA